MPSTFITAHSGCDNTAENSIEHIKRGIELKVDIIEVDVRKDNNKVLILSHDELSENNYGNYTTLERAFKIIKDIEHIKINCDLKEPGLEEDLLELAKKNNVLDKIIYTGIVDVTKIKKLIKHIEIYINLECLIPNIYIKSLSLYEKRKDLKYIEMDIKTMNEINRLAKKYKVDVININLKLCTKKFIDFANSKNIKLSIWTIDNEEEIKKFINNNVYNITSKNIRTALNIRQEYELIKEGRPAYENNIY